MIMGKLSIVQLKLLSASVHVNCFLLYDSQSGEAAVIDPGGGLGEILAELSSRALKLKYIILTHGHFDHTLCTASLKLATGAQVCMHRGDLHLKDDPCENATRFVGVENIKPFRVDVFLEDGSANRIVFMKNDIIDMTPVSDEYDVYTLDVTGRYLFTSREAFSAAILCCAVPRGG